MGRGLGKAAMPIEGDILINQQRNQIACFAGKFHTHSVNSQDFFAHLKVEMLNLSGGSDLLLLPVLGVF